jgi:hypothetical protein
MAPHEVWGDGAIRSGLGLTTFEQEAVSAALGREVERVVVPAELVGDTDAATGALQLGGLAVATQVRGIQ